MLGMEIPKHVYSVVTVLQTYSPNMNYQATGDGWTQAHANAMPLRQGAHCTIAIGAAIFTKYLQCLHQYKVHRRRGVYHPNRLFTYLL